jgi:deoxyribodipyrimidine photo-lyase
MTDRHFPSTRSGALSRLSAFVPYAARAYASGRNTDTGPNGAPHVSMLSPYLRHRIITEREVVASVLKRHSLGAAEKYVQEVLWRTYWKGWLEMRPGVWRSFLTARDEARVSFTDTAALAAAENGTTGIEGFDDWAKELAQTGYLHNHARMWFASIWIFTLRLPWVLGADFFLRHLIDADAASNTLSWRWVAGLQTAGKTYLATTDNIRRYTDGRFAPVGLATSAEALVEAPITAPTPIADIREYNDQKPALMLLTHEDMNPESLIPASGSVKSAVIAVPPELLWGDKSQQFVAQAALDLAARVESYYHCEVVILPSLDAMPIIEAAKNVQAQEIVTPYAPVGTVADRLQSIATDARNSGLELIQIRRSWDSRFWPHAKKGFFPFKEQIAKELAMEGVPDPVTPDLFGYRA